MNDFSTMIPSLGDRFANTPWGQATTWTFWFLLCVIAAGGVIHALIGKKSMVNRSICTVLNVIFVYMAMMLVYIGYAPAREALPGLPFLSASGTELTLIAPFSLELKLLLYETARFFLLVCLLNLSELFCTHCESWLSWFVAHCLTSFFAVLLFWIICFGSGVITSMVSDQLPIHLIPIVFVPLFFGCGLLILAAKLVFVYILDSDNPGFTKIYQFFTTNLFGSCLTRIFFAAPMCLGLLQWLDRKNSTMLVFGQIDLFCFGIIALFVLISLGLFNRVFNDRKK